MNNIQQWLNGHQDQMAKDLEQLCNLNSGSESVSGLHQVADWLVDYFAELQTPVSRIQLPNYSIVNDLGMEVKYDTGEALRWDFGADATLARTRLLLSIHYDTVYGPENPFQRCERFQAPVDDVEELRMRGPGVIDAKGGIVVLRWAALAAMKFIDLSQVSISILLTPDEEIGSPASVSLWHSIADKFDFAMLYEPAMADGSLVSHRRGTGTFVFVVRGRAAHSGRNFHDGRNAVVLATKIAVALDNLNGQRPNVTINVGRIRGGDAVNVVPDFCVVRVNVRVSDAEDQTWIGKAIIEIAQQYHAPDAGYQVELHGGIHAAPKMLDDRMIPWMNQIEHAAEMLGQTIRWKLSGGASDGNKLAALGLPNIDTFGPEGDLLHSDQEWIRLASLPSKAALSCEFIRRVASNQN